MKALVYHGPGSKAWEEVPMPQIIDNTDAVVRVDCTTMCGSDLHILKGDVPEVTEGRILGHEAVGTVESVGAAVTHPLVSDLEDEVLRAQLLQFAHRLLPGPPP